MNMNIETMKKQISEMDVKSDEFFQLYKVVKDKYWAFENPDTFQQMSQFVNTWLHHGKEDEIIVTAMIAKEVFTMREKGQRACTGTLGFTDETFHFDIYTTEVEKDKMHNMMADMHSKMEKGQYTVKDKFGKKYFKKK